MWEYRDNHACVQIFFAAWGERQLKAEKREGGREKFKRLLHKNGGGVRRKRQPHAHFKKECWVVVVSLCVGKEEWGEAAAEKDYKVGYGGYHYLIWPGRQ